MAYERVNWENLPSKNTPVNADNLNKMDVGINSKQDKLTAGTGIEITGTKIINNLNANYSIEEQVIGEWIDGKPLYRIVASINLQNYTSWTNLVHISNLKRVINIYGSLNNINIPRYESPSYFTQFLYENNYIKVMCNGNTGSGYLVIEYTKTTD